MTLSKNVVLHAISLSYIEDGEQCHTSTYIFLSKTPLLTEDDKNLAFKHLRDYVLTDSAGELECLKFPWCAMISTARTLRT